MSSSSAWACETRRGTVLGRSDLGILLQSGSMILYTQGRGPEAVVVTLILTLTSAVPHDDTIRLPESPTSINHAPRTTHQQRDGSRMVFRSS